MTRIDDTFARLKDEGRKAFVAYIMAGDPDHDDLAGGDARACPPPAST